jgi:6-pyruvoyltetrahydropterin/6-carboxytetrahydropterin synthase
VFRVTRSYAFAASHRLHSPRLDAEANRRTYGKCNNPYGHGHNYTLEVSARGPADETTGLAVCLGELDTLVNREVTAQFDHSNLNADIAAFRELVPTTENLAFEIGRRLKRNWSAVFPGEWPKLERIRIVETARNIFELRADEIE